MTHVYNGLPQAKRQSFAPLRPSVSSAEANTSVTQEDIQRMEMNQYNKSTVPKHPKIKQGERNEIQ